MLRWKERQRKDDIIAILQSAREDIRQIRELVVSMPPSAVEKKLESMEVKMNSNLSEKAEEQFDSMREKEESNRMEKFDSNFKSIGKEMEPDLVEKIDARFEAQGFRFGFLSIPLKFDIHPNPNRVRDAWILQINPKPNPNQVGFDWEWESEAAGDQVWRWLLMLASIWPFSFLVLVFDPGGDHQERGTLGKEAMAAAVLELADKLKVKGRAMLRITICSKYY